MKSIPVFSTDDADFFLVKPGKKLKLSDHKTDDKGPFKDKDDAESTTAKNLKKLADLQDVYDERGFGDKSPEAVRAFIQAARAGWRVPPRFVLLVGDATSSSAQTMNVRNCAAFPREAVRVALRSSVPTSQPRRKT